MEIIPKTQITEQEPKNNLSVEEMINEQNIKQETADDDNEKVCLELAEDTKTIVHISPIRQPKETQTDDANKKIIHSPICKEYNQKLKKLQKRIRSFSPETKVQKYSVSTTTSNTSASTSVASSVPTSMVSSLESFDVKRLFGSGGGDLKVTDSILSRISISETDTLCGDSSDSSDQEYEDLKESLNRQWNEIQFTLNNLAI